ncbi:hypothetical protein [Bacillus marasmi]|uniref:YqgU-like beta propeller domain-containing protein n=1 Tax=Bacillus marasmi TaxID=1926279 RepID=UPI0011C762A7|nr:hypothetical protein [Bacillus marasmi]
MKGRNKKNSISIFGLFMLLISISLFSGCTGEKSSGGEAAKKEARREQAFSSDNIQSPLPKVEGEFGKIIGWLSDETIVYITHINQGSTVHTYHLFSGKQQQIYESKRPIISASISPSRDKILLHTSSGNSQGTIIIIGQNGKSLVEKKIDSAELSFVWNSYDENLVLVTAFNDQWEFTVSILNIDSNKLEESKLTQQPFMHWVGMDEVIYLDWDVNEPSFFASPVKQKITEEKGKNIDLENVFQLYAFGDTILTISTKDDNPEEATYSFLSKDLKRKQSFSIPHLTRFSDWLVPYHDFNKASNQFFTLRPIGSGAADTYQEGFQLVRYSLNNEKEELVFEGLDNKPISISPNGEFCLYGYQLENLIVFDSNEIVALVKS